MKFHFLSKPRNSCRTNEKINLGWQVFGDNFRFWGFSGSAQCLLADWWSLADLRVDEIKSGNPEKEDKM